jgi:hypothetical protein
MKELYKQGWIFILLKEGWKISSWGQAAALSELQQGLGVIVLKTLTQNRRGEG